jgi:GT2 family glycosyltransferase/ABC-type nitrate/sulfonate/bicarbonate transport system ATPase subunit
VRGVTYGTFRPTEDGVDYPPAKQVDGDFAGMAAAGFNTVRTYTVPPRWLLDAALRHELLVMVGMPWEQHIAFLDEPKRCEAIEESVRAGVRACAGHPAVLAYTIGNEIPASIVRWHGRRRIGRFLERLYRAAKQEDPGGLVTYVNFPTTEYLELTFLDFCAFNVYLESEDRLEAYLARLQVVADERPLLMAEIGLDSRRNGVEAQAESLCWQLRTTFRAGCAGATVFAWTDEWHRGGFDVEDWDFGLVRRDRSPKPALEAVRGTLAELPLPPGERWPRFSVVVCSFNGSRTIGECLAAASTLDYPDYEVIVVDDGSTDDTAEIARAHGARVISTPNEGLGSARNRGAREATGEIVAYCDDDAAPERHWLTYLATTYMTTEHAAVGGPNIAPRADGTVAECVANAPGNAIHVLLSDTVAEHIPGCNSSFRREALLEVGGFDPQFRIAGDDVDLCWRLQDRGWTIGFTPAAMVWHHRRGSVRAYWRQQRAYGRAEAMLERKWPERYNGTGHVSWAGRVYATGRRTFLERSRVYHGTWGTGSFQRLYTGGQPRLAHLPLMPEWFLVIALLTGLTALGTTWTPLLIAAPLLALALAAVAGEAWTGAGRARFTMPVRTRRMGLRLRALTAFLFVLQSYARLHGRLREGLRPWGRRAPPALRLPYPRVCLVWSEAWQPVEQRLHHVEAALRNASVRVRRGGDFDRWDLDVRGGVLAGARVRMAVEEHGGGRQQLRFRVLPRAGLPGLVAAASLAALVPLAALDGAIGAAGVLGTLAVALVAFGLVEAAAAIAAAELAVDSPPIDDHRLPATPALVQLIEGQMGLGEVAAVVGGARGRKQALTDLLLALYRPRDGGNTQGMLNAGDPNVVVLPPDPVLLPLSVTDNIALGRPGASQEDIHTAARAAGADGFIQRLPHGYDTVVGDQGTSLTDEQSHRLALARAFLQDARILILAEPIDHIGNGSGGRLREPIELLAQGRRTLVVADSRDDAGEASRVFAVEGESLVELP